MTRQTLSRRTLIAGFAAAVGAAALPNATRAAIPKRIGLDYAYYNPASLVLKKFGWAEDALRPHGVQIDWLLSLGSNKANGLLAGNAVQFGSTAGSAALLARANGSPIKTVFLYSQPEWTALVVAKNSPLRSVKELRGKRVAATKGTDPWFFLLRSLHQVGLTQQDVEILDLQHGDGRTALERGNVDAWAGLDPYMAATQLDAGSRLLYRNLNFNTYGALNAREDFINANPELTQAVLRAYERARHYAIAYPHETSQILAEASGISLRVADIEIRERTHYPDPVPGAAYRKALEAVIPIIEAEHLAVPGANLRQDLVALIDSAPAHVAVSGG
ncbi:aliphatic sulfonate ABC transporter substrate-binding protein [bacterium]|nr:MAG: aliphatic sulfonate ABC transporter substrate-binding protein [bacterium]